MPAALTVLIVGGYGTFGGRLARLLSDVSGLTILIGGRSLEQAKEFCSAGAGLGAARDDALSDSSRSARARLVPVRFDRAGDVEGQLRQLAPNIVVDASGPFQFYGERPYPLVEGCVACGVDYLDLADGTAFVNGIAAFDDRARERGIFVLSGVSSFPVLTAAVVRALSSDLARVAAIRGGIAPSPFANVGLNVIRAIASYAGKPVRLRRGARDGLGHALTETMRYTVAPPGILPLRRLTFSLVDVPDLQLLAQLWPECGTVWMGAAPVPAIWHALLRGLSRLVRWRVLPSLSGLAPLMYRAINRLAWGEHRGGMFVEIDGTDRSGAAVRRSWHLVAEKESGPLIPSMAAEAIIRRCFAGRRPAAGARSATRELELTDYVPLLARHQIAFGERRSACEVASRGQPSAQSALSAESLYQRVLGSAWSSLPASLRDMHSVARSATVSGRADVRRGKSVLARLVAAFIRFPGEGTDVPVEVRFDVRDGRETWTRRFAGRTFHSEQFEGTGRYERLICERFGPFTMGLALVVAEGRLSLIVRDWSFLGTPLPRFLAPHSNSHESERDGRFHFDVALSHPLTGLIVHYRGWLRHHP
jgi:uncharacterized protein DUF4166/saccharopine dehydrogenase-like protein